MNTDLRTVVIMARGLGTRMRKAADVDLSGTQSAMADQGIKALIDVGRPFLDYVISACADAGVTRAVLVIGPEHQAIRDYYDGLPKERVSVEYAVQAEPLGTGDALHAAREAVGDERFLLLNSDNYYPVEVLRALAATPGHALAGFSAKALVAESNIPAERVAAFAVVGSEGGALTEIVEKPDAATLARFGDDPAVSMNCFAFTPAIFRYTGTLEKSPRGEYELVDAVRAAVADGERVEVVPVRAGVLDMSSRSDITAVQEALAGHEVRL